MKRSLKTLLYALPLIAFGACSSDELLGGKDDFIAKDTETRYLKVNLVNAASQTRAIGDNATADYANGTEAENKIHTLDFIFYDADKEFHSHVNRVNII